MTKAIEYIDKTSVSSDFSASYIQIKDVSVVYKKQNGFTKNQIKAVNNLSLNIEKGEILGIIGESGSGKSTLAKVLVDLQKPSSGAVFIGGKSIDELIKTDYKKFRRTVQIIFQNPFDTFTPKDTIGKIMMRPLSIHKIGADKTEKYQICVDALKKGGLSEVSNIMDRYPHELSGGQLQRISILRSMLLNPEIIIADEPVSMLDVSVRAEIINMLIEVKRSLNATLIFISHDIMLTQYIADKIAVMNSGEIVEYGSADDIVKNPTHPYTVELIASCLSV